MQRIGLAASKMSKGSLGNYNLYVILIACLLSFLFFLICGFSILLVLFLVSLTLHLIKPPGFHFAWHHILKICLMVLALIIGILNLIAIAKNIKLKKTRI